MQCLLSTVHQQMQFNITNSLCARLSREIPLPEHHVNAIQMLVALNVAASKASIDKPFKFHIL